MDFKFLPSKLTAQVRSSCVPFNSNHS